MDKLKNPLILLAVAVVVSVGLVWGLGIGGKQGPQGPAGGNGANGQDGKFGALAGPDIPSPYLRWGDVALFNAKMALNTATNTPCAIQSPAATSTLLTTTLQITTGTSTATAWYVSTSTSAFATTTNLVPPLALGSGKQGTFAVASSTAGAVYTVDNNVTLSPSTWIVWTVAGTAITLGDTTHLLGTCQARFESI